MKSLPNYSFLALLIFSFSVHAQIITTDPALPTASDAVIIYFDATLGSGGLVGYNDDVYAHTGVLTNLSSGVTDWKYVKTDWGVNSTETKLTRVSDNFYSLDIGPTIREYYGVSETETITHMAFVFRSSDSSLEGKGDGGSDIFVEVFEEGLSISIIKPDRNTIVDPGNSIDFEAASSQTADLKLYLNDSEVKATTGTSITHTFTFDTAGDFWIRTTAEAEGETLADSVFVHVKDAQANGDVPNAMTDGINYPDEQSATLVLYAPKKEDVFAIGDFNNWIPNSASRMTKDGDRFWITLNNLNPGEVYGFQYLVDGELLIADPYTTMTLDPNDKWIDEATYPGLKAYPSGLTAGITAVLQPGQPAYDWDHSGFTAPEQAELVIYELHVRDFIAAHNWKTLSDTLGYLATLGINAIELMPVNEFEGNESWGYNPSFYFAPDKYYGPAEDLKVFIDSCHGRDIAVIIDMVLNHSYDQSPLVQMYFENGKISADNPWYNVNSPNPTYSWGHDFNHESQHTKDFMDRVNGYWLDSFHVDGFRFDFTKGFTNKAGEGWDYDASRIAILKRMADVIWSVNSDAYVILEHLTANTEEEVLSDYGMMLWGNMNHNYNEATMGYHDSGKSNFSGISYKSRGWNDPHLVGYMESHDEERLMFKNIEYGNSSVTYNIQDRKIAIKRMELAGAFFFTIPGPKMIWQFGELGYDYSIDYNGRVGNKPIRWDYFDMSRREGLYQVWSAIIKLRKSEPAFRTNDFTLNLGGAVKRIELNHESMDVRIIGNFDVELLEANASFSKTGWWYDFFSGDSLEVSDLNMLLPLEAGAFRIYTSERITPPSITAAVQEIKEENGDMQAYPNPFMDMLHLQAWEVESSVSVVNLAGVELFRTTMLASNEQLDLSLLPEGLFILTRTGEGYAPAYARIVKVSR